MDLTRAELQNHCELLILGSWGLSRNRDGSGQTLIITVVGRRSSVSNPLLVIHYVLGIATNALRSLPLIFIFSLYEIGIVFILQVKKKIKL